MYGRRVPKNHPRVEACGTIDELNSAIGRARATAGHDFVRENLFWIQKSLVDVMGEVGNIVLTSYLNELVALTGIAAEPSPPSVAHGSPAAVLELPIARAASDSDIVLQVDSMLLMPGSSGAIPTRAPFHIIFLPTPGSMSLLLHGLTPQHPFTARERVDVPMGELAVSRRANHHLVASSLGSCIAVAIIDSITRVAAVAHIMLPEAPGLGGQRYLQRSYPARFADTAIPALLDALEQAGGKRMYAQVYLAGGGQMFRGPLADSLDIPDQNIAAVTAAVQHAGLTITAADLGGHHGRSLEIDMATLAVSVARDGLPAVRLQAA